MNKLHLKSDYLYILLFFLLFFSIPKGIIVGGDWTFPFSNFHLEEFFNITTWNKQNFGSESSLSLNLTLFKIIILFLNKIGIDIIYIQKILIFIISLSGYLFFSLLGNYLCNISLNSKFLKLISFCYVLAPISFNYLQMGWILSFIAYCFLPGFLYFFLKYVEHEKTYYLTISILIFCFSIMQVQAVLWYYIILILFYFNHRFYNRSYIKKLIIFFILSTLLNSFWLIPSILSNFYFSPELLNNVSKLSTTSGIDASLNSDYLLRNLGSLYNLNFETSLNLLLPTKYFVLITSIPFIIIFYFIFRLDKISSFSFIIFFSIIFFYFVLLTIKLFPEFFYSAEIFSIIRHKGRFIVLTSFLTFLLIIYLHQEILKKQIKLGIIFNTLIILLLINLIPWTKDFLFKNEHTTNQYLRYLPIRTINIDEDYDKFYKKIKNDKDINSVIYFPHTVSIRVNDDIRFYKSFKNFTDQYSALSPKPGNLYFNERTEQDILINNIFFNNTLNGTKYLYNNLLHDVDLFVLRKNIITEKFLTEAEFKNIFNNNNFEIYFENRKLIAFQKKNINTSLFQLTEILNINENNLLRNNNYHSYNNQREENQILEYSTILNHIYKIKIEDKLLNYNKLVFRQKYHPGWKVLCSNQKKLFKYLTPLNLIKNRSYEYNKQIIFLNNDQCKNYFIIFIPEIIFYFFLIFSILILSMLILKSFYEFKKN